MIEDVSSVVIQITSLVIVPNTPSMIKRRLLSNVEAIVKATPRRKKYVSWHLTATSLRIINKNKQLRAKNEVLKREACELKTKIEQLERDKEISLECESCDNLQTKISSLTLKLASFKNSSSSLQEMLEMQKPPKDKHGIGYTDDIASTSNTETKKLGPKIVKIPSVEPALPVPSAREPASSDEPNRLSAAKTEIAEKLGNDIVKKNDSVLITRKSTSNISKSVKQPPILKLGQGLGKSKIQTHPKTPHRNSNTLYPKSNYHQVGWNYGTQQEYQFQPPMFNQWGPCPPYPYMSQPNVKLEPDEWIKDSGCSRHMTGNKDLFSSYKTIDGGNVVFGGNTKSKIVGKDTISHNSLTIHDVSHVENLGFNLLSIGQICDKKCKVLFSETGSEIIKDGITIGRGIRKNGLYIMKMGNSLKDRLCLTSIYDTSTLWHRRLGHANIRLIQSLSSKELVRNLPKLKFESHFCDACNIGKQVHTGHKSKNMVSTTKCLELLHMDLFRPSAVQSYRGNFYTLVIVDDYSRYTWTRFLKHKNEAFDHFEILSKKIQVQKGCLIISIHTNHGREFDNEVQFGAFCDANGITHNFSAPRTPQSNGVVERKNRTLQEMSRTMLNEQSIPQKLWCNVVDTSTYILNRILIRPFLGKTPYELFKAWLSGVRGGRLDLLERN
ncbi:retrovirus-related pol polyprotein from transposon TNT 1-94 [Tanacetum coccineum]